MPNAFCIRVCEIFITMRGWKFFEEDISIHASQCPMKIFFLSYQSTKFVSLESYAVSLLKSFGTVITCTCFSAVITLIAKIR